MVLEKYVAKIWITLVFDYFKLESLKFEVLGLALLSAANEYRFVLFSEAFLGRISYT